ncbi:MAG TPA: hypothetical protein VK140_15025 [Ktedonobacteraceae bacterium]|nr:hypothetical protein [Ktedonobacteraceae bacterium]
MRNVMRRKRTTSHENSFSEDTAEQLQRCYHTPLVVIEQPRHDAQSCSIFPHGDRKGSPLLYTTGLAGIGV